MVVNLSLIYAALLLVVAVFAGYVARWLFMPLLDRSLVRRGVDSAVTRTISAAIPFWALIIGIQMALALVPIQAGTAGVVRTGLLALAVIVTTWVMAKVATELTIRYGNSIGAARAFGSMAQNLVKLAVLIIGGAILLSALGVHVTAIVASLGIGALAVALAFQDTLSNIFAGLSILADQPVRVGDFIKLQTGEEGFVGDIGWRSTRIRTLSNYVIVIPNKKLSESIIHNYSMPDTTYVLSIPISVGYGADPDRVISILVDETRRAAKHIPEIVQDFEPAARLHPGFGESSLNFTLTCKVKQYADQVPVADELRRRIIERFRKEGVELARLDSLLAGALRRRTDAGG